MRRRPLVTAVAGLSLGAALLQPSLGAQAASSPISADQITRLIPKGEHESGEEEQNFDKLRDAYYWSRLLAGDDPITLDQAAGYREDASRAASKIKSVRLPGETRGGTWEQQGPNPIVQVVRTSNTYAAMSGRIGALAFRNDGSLILGAAQGGVWTYDAATKTWTSRTADADTQSVGALAVAPSNDSVVYLGTGEGALSGDSYFGDGIWRSADGGKTWSHVSTTFTGQATSAIVVDPKNADHLFAATLRGRGGAKRTTAPAAKPYGVWESVNGGKSWKLLKGTTDELHGATDLVLDPQDPKTLYASFWGDGIYRSTDGGATWTSALGNLPAGNFLEGGTRFALGISHPAGAPATLYTGYDYFDLKDVYHGGAIWKTTDGGTTWVDATGSPTKGPDSVAGYCGTQCFYDNVVKPDPNDPNIVYALGSYGYNNSPQSGGIYRSTDGGATWKSLGYDLHPDFHALAFQPTDTKHIAIGNDGGVWQSSNRGGRLGAGDPLKSVDWENLNGAVDPKTGALVRSSGLAIAMFTSIATVPRVPGQYWGGTQDNGTLRKLPSDQRWVDQASGDGGQVIVDQTTPNPYSSAAPAFVFGSYYGISPYRYSPDKVYSVFGNEAIDGGIDMKDRAEFYVPWVQNRANPNQLFLGTYRLYRTDNGEAPNAGDVTWAPISGDLTTGCPAAAPNGARGCLISAVGVADGGDGVWVGTDDGVVSVSPDAVTSDSPTWTRVGENRLPNRPVTNIAVDRSNWRIAYVSYAGFNAATPGNRGHVFVTKDGGRTFRNASGNLPDVPVNSVVIDPSDTDTIYVGTDVGPFVSSDGGRSYDRLGSGIPKVSIWQLDYDATNGVLVAGTHGRSAYTLKSTAPSSALVVSKADAGKPVGPGSTIDYAITVKNIGNAPSKGVEINDQVPQYTTFVSADNGGSTIGRRVHWENLSIPAGGQITVKFSVAISKALPSSVTSIVNDGIEVEDASNVGTTGSPHTTPIAPAHKVVASPAAQTGGAKVGTSTSYTLDLTNLGYLPDTYAVAASGTWATTIYDATCTTALGTTATVAPGDTVKICVKVAVPASAKDEDRDTATVTATSTADATVTATSKITTIAVAQDTLLVDQDGDAPDVSASYKAAMGSRPYAYWDLSKNPELPASYLNAHSKVVWWTGNTYPAPITPYETELSSFLDNGGRLLLSGQDILDQAAGTTGFVKKYLHVDWDGTETQNDKETSAVNGVAGNPVTNGIGAVTIDHSVLKATFEDRVTPIPPGAAAFKDDSGDPDAVTAADGAYKVFFLAFPVEAYGSAADRADLVGRTFTWFSS